jgi:hydrogenase/urease accessory protein HupE
MLRALLFALVLLQVLGPAALAHESRPAYLQVTEIEADTFEVLWRTPLSSGAPLPVLLVLPADAQQVREPILQQFPDSLLQRQVIALAGGIAGKRIEFPGLQATITDVLVRIRTLGGMDTTVLVQPDEPWVDVPAESGTLAVAGAFIVHGVEHILFGYDHLLFVLALILIVRSLRTLLWTITAFTLAHSITLGLATLGVVSVPSAPVEAMIALSILLLASEILRMQRGEPSLTARVPWAVAFCFGLLHGFGFAGALTSIGLPQGEIPEALFFFNVGVELGQLAFVAVILGILALLRRLGAGAAVSARQALTTASYAIGTVATFWLFERLASFTA